MIVIARRVGQLGNRLILFAHFIACARDNKVAVYNPAFHEYARHFEATRYQVVCCHRPDGPAAVDRPSEPSELTRAFFYQAAYLPSRGLAAIRCTHWPVKIIRIRMNQSYDLGSPELSRLLARRSIVVVHGWLFRGHAALARHADAIRKFFRPAQPHAEGVARVLTEAGGRGDVLVGIHFRQGDYRTAFGGKYYYTADQYQAVMQRIERFFAPRQVTFLVCGDQLDQAHWLASRNVVCGTGHAVQDMYAFAECDYLVGPPSTFTGWASFYGNVPLCPLLSAGAEIRFPNHPRDGNRAA